MKKVLKILLSILFFILLFNESILSQARIAVYYSKQTENLDQLHSTKVINHITFLELLFMQNKIPYKVIYKDELEDGLGDDFDLLILPSVDVLSEDEFNSINSFVSNGKSIFIIKSKLEIYSENNYPLYQESRGISGINYIEIEPSNLSVIQSYNYDMIINENYKFDNSILLTQKNKLLSSEINSSFFYSLGELKSQDKEKNLSSIFIGKLNKGKLAWLGFNQDDVIGGEEDFAEFKALILDIIKYLDIDADIGVKTLPNDFDSYKVITLKYNNLLEPQLIDKLHLDGFTPQLVIALYTKLPENIKSKFNDENFILDLTILNLDKISAQQLSDTLNYFREVSNINIQNIILNKHYFPKPITESLRGLGVKTILVSPDYYGLQPTIIDEIIILHYQISTSENNWNNFINYTPSVRCESNPEDDFLYAISKIDKTKNWITNLSSLREWWIKRSNIKVQLSKQENGVYRILIRNNNYSEVNNVAVYLNLPSDIDLNLLTISENRNLFDYRLDNKTGIVRLEVQTLKSQESRTLLISTN